MTIDHLIEIAEFAEERGIPLCPSCGDFHFVDDPHTTD